MYTIYAWFLLSHLRKHNIFGFKLLKQDVWDFNGAIDGILHEHGIIK